MHRVVWILCLLGVLSGCVPGDPAWEEANPLVALPEPPLGVQADFETLQSEQGLVITPEKVRLGKWLFFDPRLSADGSISCATCHRPEHGFSEPTPTSTGIGQQVGARKSPPIVNAAFPFYPVYFWDGRAASLAEQAKGPIENPIEMGNTHTAMVASLQGIQSYGPYFAEAFGDPAIDVDRVAEAIAAFEVTLYSGDSPYDRFRAGDKEALSEQARQGKELFENKAGCAECHVSWNFTDSKFHSLGVGWDPERGEYRDTGRFQVTGNAEDLGAFKTPTLRDVALHAPYMHDGSMATLEEVMDHYNKGGTPGAANLSGKVRSLELTPEESAAVVAFLHALTGGQPRVTPPAAFPE